MQEPINDWSTIPARPSHKKSSMSSTLLRLLCGGLGCVIVVAVAVAALVPQLMNRQKTQADSVQSTTKGHVKLQLDNNAHILTIQTKIINAPPNTSLIMHVHGDGNCTGPILFMMQATSNDTGSASATMTFGQDANNKPLPTTIPSNWYYNVHDTTRTNPANGKPLSIACGSIQVDSSGLVGTAHLSPVQLQSTTHGLAILHLDPNAHTLNILASVAGAPLSTSLVMHVHSKGSCTGPILFTVQALSDDVGNASTTMTFSQDANNSPIPTPLPNDWYFNVHDTTRQGSNGKSLSIACGSIQTADATVSFAQLNPVQQSSATATPSVTTTATTTTTPLNPVSGLAIFHLDPSAHTLKVRVSLTTIPPNIPLVMDVHGDGSCTGQTLFTMQATSDDVGNATVTIPFSQDSSNLLSSPIPNNWFFNVHDATKQGSDDMPASIACGPIHVVDPTTAFAKLDSSQQSPATQSTTSGLAVLYLSPKTPNTVDILTKAIGIPSIPPGTLNILANIVSAPSNIPLVMDVHGDGSCTGQVLFTLQATSDDAGHASVTMTFSQDANNQPLPTTLPSNWFFNVHDTTRQGSDGKPVSIACGPIQLIQLVAGVGTAKLSPV